MVVTGPILQPGLAGRYPLLAVELGARRRDVRFGDSISVGSLAAVGRELPIGPTCRLWTLSCRWGSATAVVQHRIHAEHPGRPLSWRVTLADRGVPNLSVPRKTGVIFDKLNQHIVEETLIGKSQMRPASGVLGPCRSAGVADRLELRSGPPLRPSSRIPQLQSDPIEQVDVLRRATQVPA